jgi:hypothetical protein
MSVQTSYSEAPVTARKGQLANGDHKHEAGRMSGAAVVGNLVSIGGNAAGELSAGTVTALAELAVSADAILASTATANTALSITSASTPALTTSKLNPARRITAVLSSHADWNLTKMRIYGEAWDGTPLKEELTVPDGGNTTITTHQFFSRVTKVELDAQAAAGGSFTMGYTASEGIYDPATVGILMRNTSREPLDSSDQVATEDRVDVLMEGDIFVASEAAVAARGPAYLRTANDTGVVRGQWSSAPAANFTVQPWAEFVTKSDGATPLIAVLRKK